MEQVEQRVTIECGASRLRALLSAVPGKRGAVVTHPHPLYGGDMQNNVVEAVYGAYRVMGYGALRFNFRGAGGSEGEYDGGRGEQDDVEAALEKLAGAGSHPLDLAGYSFGGWVNACGLGRFARAERAILVAPPVGLLDFSILKNDPRLALVIAGSEDDFAPLDLLHRALPLWNPRAELVVIEGADHFFWNRTAELGRALRRFLERDAP